MAYVKEALGANEHIVMQVRKHPIVLLKPFLFHAVLIMLIVVGAVSLSEDDARLFPPLVSVAVFPLCLFLLSWLTWSNEEYFLTNRRVIQSEGVLSKRMSDSSLEKVTDVVLSQSWVGRVLNYGDVEILTASEAGVNLFKTISMPVRFKTEMLNQKEQLGSDEGIHQEGASPGIPALIMSLERLRKEGVLTEKEFQDKKKQLLAKM